VAGRRSEKTHVRINGVDQGMFITSKNIENPVLLFVHGGPGFPAYWLTQRYPTGLEDHFTVAWWEQRGAGLSYRADIPPDTMTADQFVEDTLEVTRYLCERFEQDTIYLMGHSWGSYIGIQAAAKAPEFYAAYTGVGQISCQLESEQMAYAYALEYHKDHGDDRMVRKLRAAPPGTTVPLPANYFALRDKYMHGAGIGTMREMKSVITGLFPAVVDVPGIHREGEGEPVARQALLAPARLRPLGHAARHRHEDEGSGAPDSRLLLPREIRLHLRISACEELLRAPRSAPEGVLHVRELRTLTRV
jgi:pimeloyl-ACP methyl ester carboxylesterase